MELDGQVCASAASNRGVICGGSRCKGGWVNLLRDLQAAKKSWPGIWASGNASDFNVGRFVFESYPDTCYFENFPHFV